LSAFTTLHTYAVRAFPCSAMSVHKIPAEQSSRSGVRRMNDDTNALQNASFRSRVSKKLLLPLLCGYRRGLTGVCNSVIAESARAEEAFVLPIDLSRTLFPEASARLRGPLPVEQHRSQSPVRLASACQKACSHSSTWTARRPHSSPSTTPPFPGMIALYTPNMPPPPPPPACAPCAALCIFSLTFIFTSKNLATHRSMHTLSPLFRSASR
jgi:hypothetical protein